MTPFRSQLRSRGGLVGPLDRLLHGLLDMVALEVRNNDIVYKRCRVAGEADDILELRTLPDGGHL